MIFLKITGFFLKRKNPLNNLLQNSSRLTQQGGAPPGPLGLTQGERARGFPPAAQERRGVPRFLPLWRRAGPKIARRMRRGGGGKTGGPGERKFCGEPAAKRGGGKGRPTTQAPRGRGRSTGRRRERRTGGAPGGPREKGLGGWGEGDGPPTKHGDGGGRGPPAPGVRVAFNREEGGDFPPPNSEKKIFPVGQRPRGREEGGGVDPGLGGQGGFKRGKREGGGC